MARAGSHGAALLHRNRVLVRRRAGRGGGGGEPFDISQRVIRTGLSGAPAPGRERCVNPRGGRHGSRIGQGGRPRRRPLQTIAAAREPGLFPTNRLGNCGFGQDSQVLADRTQVLCQSGRSAAGTPFPAESNIRSRAACCCRSATVPSVQENAPIVSHSRHKRPIVRNPSLTSVSRLFD